MSTGQKLSWNLACNLLISGWCKALTEQIKGLQGRQEGFPTGTLWGRQLNQ